MIIKRGNKMLLTLKRLLNIYSDDEIKEMDLWINSDEMIESIIIDGGSIDLITDSSEIKIDDYITKEGK